MNRADAERWQRQLYAEVRLERQEQADAATPSAVEVLARSHA
jgi:hypothetical protein